MSISSSGKGRVLATLAGAAGVVLWATETTFVNLLPDIPPLQLVALAFAFASILTPASWLVTRQNPLIVLKAPLWVWVLMISALVGYHACIYYATQRAPAAPAALLHGTTPLLIVIGSAFLPGERLRWWHVAGAVLGFAGVFFLVKSGGELSFDGENAILYLSMIGVAAGLWGLYSVVARSLPEIPSSSLGVFYAASAAVAFAGHLAFETWVTPAADDWWTIAALGLLPMGLAIFLWDYGVKRGDIQALGAISYGEPFVGAALVALVTGAVLGMDMLWAATLIVGGAILGSASLWKKESVHAQDGLVQRVPTPAANVVPPTQVGESVVSRSGVEVLSIAALAPIASLQSNEPMNERPVLAYDRERHKARDLSARILSKLVCENSLGRDGNLRTGMTLLACTLGLLEALSLIEEASEADRSSTVKQASRAA